MKNSKTLLAKSLALVLIYPLAGQAALSPNSIGTENGLTVTPYLNAQWSYDDNYTQSEQAKSSNVYSISPLIEISAERNAHSFGTSISSTSNFYSTDSDFNHSNFYINADANLALAIRHRVIFKAGYAYEHDAPGSGVTEGLGDVINELAKFEDSNAQLLYQYGADGAKGKLTLSSQYFKKRYKNFRNLQGDLASRSTRFKDNNKLTLGSKLDVNARDDVYWFLDFSVADSEFPHDAIQDNKHFLYYVGTSWDLTGKTQGNVKFGWQDKKYDTTYRDFDGLSWTLGLTWTPLKHATFGLDTSKVAEDPSVGNGTNDTTNYSVYWRHDWSSILSSKVKTSYKDDEYTSGGRRDETIGVGVSATYQINRWSELSIGTDYTDKDSNRDGFGYDQWISYLSCTLTI